MRAVAVIGVSGAGKTTLCERLVPALRELGLRAGYLKHAHKGFQMDKPGADTERLFETGAAKVVIVSAREGAIRFRHEAVDLDALLEEAFSGCDLVLVEGFKQSALPKIEVRHGAPVLAEDDPTLAAVVCEGDDPRPVPRFRPDDVAEVARFVAHRLLGRI